jgi:hypothetical protein
MAALGKLLDRYEPLFASRGYSRCPAQERGPSFQSCDGRLVIYDRIRGGSLRCFLSHGNPPFLTAESPWWNTDHDDTLATAVAASWDFLLAAGFAFLDSPTTLTVTDWRVRHNLLVRDSRPGHLTLTWPSSWSLNELVMAAKRSIPHYRSVSALDLRDQLATFRSISITDLSYLDALELVPLLSQQGFTTALNTP